jgi:Ni,Fe-hydrogenase III small subunit
MPSWISRAWKKGIVTTTYPVGAPTGEEIPPTGCPVGVEDAATFRSAAAIAEPLCPTGAITPAGVDQGQCIRCTRCFRVGFGAGGAVESGNAAREGLIWISGTPPALRVEPAPLAPIGRSIHVFLMDVGSCNACNLEVLALANPYYDAARLGISFTNSPRHADVLAVVGVPTEPLVEPLRRTYDAMPAPKAVLAVGACAIDGGIFEGNPGLEVPVRTIVPVDLYVSGCPPPPLAVLDGILRLAGRNRVRNGGER